ncbi:hypothetical protein TWF696_005826 [Orbilia brochopaga]|uniref:Uncharacterized protein n=1 Tax=Orbilia brochopaga TaxID=3140254 RepID=A0AAV9UUG6_9PEZI
MKLSAQIPMSSSNAKALTLRCSIYHEARPPDLTSPSLLDSSSKMYTIVLALVLLAGIRSLPIPRPTQLPGLADTGPLHAPAAPKPVGPPGSESGYTGKSTNAYATDDKLHPDGRHPVGYVQYNPPMAVANPPVVVKPVTVTKTALALPPIAVPTAVAEH